MTTALRPADAALSYAETLRPGSFDALVKFAERMSHTALVPKSFHGKPDDIVAAVMFGADLGLAPLQSLQSVAVVNGRPTIWGDAALAVCQAHSAWEWIRETHEGAGDTRTAVCEVKRRGMDAHAVRFGAADAKRAGLWGKDTYKAYPDRMLQMRARGFALRNTFADALKGLITREEAEDFERAEVIATTPGPPQKTAAESVREKLAAQKTTTLTARISAARTEAELRQVAEDIAASDGGQIDQDALRSAYKSRLQALRDESRHTQRDEPAHDDVTGEVAEPLAEDRAALAEEIRKNEDAAKAKAEREAEFRARHKARAPGEEG